MSTTTDNRDTPRSEYRIKTETRVNSAPDKTSLEVAADKIENGAIVTEVEMEDFEDISPAGSNTYITSIAKVTLDRPTLADRVEKTLENEIAVRSATVI